MRTTADWVGGGLLMVPASRKTFTITASVTGNQGHRSTTTDVVAVSDVGSGQDLTTTP